MLKKEEILKQLAPCSLLCRTCTAYHDGVICKAAGDLLKYLDGIEAFYQKHMPDAVESYKNFEGVLRMYGGGACGGCRSEEHHGCSIQGCFLLACTREHGVDVCGECEEFPCGKTEELFEKEVYEQWLSGNQEIREKGIQAFWERHATMPHYQAYRK